MLNTEDNYSGAYSSSYYVEDASFLRLKISYWDIPCLRNYSRRPVSRISACTYKPRISPTITGYAGLDPEFTNAYLRQSDSDNDGAGRVDLKKRSRYGRLANNHAVLIGREFYFLNPFYNKND